VAFFGARAASRTSLRRVLFLISSIVFSNWRSMREKTFGGGRVPLKRARFQARLRFPRRRAADAIMCFQYERRAISLRSASARSRRSSVFKRSFGSRFNLGCSVALRFQTARQHLDFRLFFFDNEIRARDSRANVFRWQARNHYEQIFFNCRHTQSFLKRRIFC